MIDIKTVPTTTLQVPERLDRAATAITLLYQVIALVAFALVPIFAYSWLSTPFLGVFTENSLVTNGIGPSGSRPWAAFAAGANRFGDQIIALEGIPVHTAQEMQQILRAHKEGETITLTLARPEGDRLTLSILLHALPLADQFAFLYLPYLLGLVYLGASLWVFSLRRQDASGRTFAIFSTSTALGMGLLFDLYTTHRLTHVWTAAIGLVGAGLFTMALVFPQEVRPMHRHPILRWVAFVPAGALIANAFIQMANRQDPRAYALGWRNEYIATAVGVITFLGLTAYRRYASRSPIAREQARIILLGSLVAFAPIVTWIVLTVINPLFVFRPVFLLTLVVFPIATAYAILRYRLLNTDYVLSRAVTYALLTVLSAAVYTLLIWGSALVFGQVLSATNPLTVGVLAFILALGANPARLWLQNKVDRLFFRGQTVYQERLQNFSHELTQAVELPRIVNLLHRYIDESISPSQLHIYLYDPLSGQYLASANEQGKPSSDIRFSSHSALVQALAHDNTSIYLGDTDSLPARLLPDRARLGVLDAQLFVALPGQQQLTGWLALGPRRSGEPFGRKGLAFIESLCDQAALAIERAQVVFDLERRVHEMNVLARIAQGVNVTINFDDILELIYAQTNQVLTAQDFRVTLFDKNTRTFYHAFYLENDERLPEKENRPLPEGYGLEQEIVRSQRALVTEDYERECRSRGILPSGQGLYAWIGVPLKTGVETIGAISLGSNDPSILYTQQQMNLLQAIADQAAGAIVKTQLIQETERRARQLSTLNLVGRSLTSTLELDPLLHRILESAVDILNCEAGTLFLVDEQTGELVFSVTVGPVAGDLAGTRLAPGTGLAGKAVDTRQPIIDNNVHKSKDWFEKTDQKTGFVSRAILAVPMQVRDEVLGVVQVINKKDGSPFHADDERLLTAFTAQAAVAVQNARLFTNTDQALAAKVEELSVMQRIDRELNASLDARRAMHISLDWAVRQTGAEAGFAATFESEEQNLVIMAAFGYKVDLPQPESIAHILAMPAVRAAIQTAQPQRRQRLTENQATEHLLPQAHSQIVIPIRREETVIGILCLESLAADQFSDERLAFLVRLSDHAAIAISNAQLYAAVQAANLAKSDFVSFVSHELKTPMTSIKGYTDLLSAGAVGPINEAQSGFLATIRSNVNRMATLVSDLADISRIEAGRLRLDFGAVSMEEIIDEIVRSTHRQLEDKEQTLTLEISEGLPQVWGDRTRLVQVLTNLVSNAHKYTPNKGHLTIQVETSANQWDADGTPNVVRVAVSDTGIGLKPEDQKHIFTKFFRSEDVKAREAPGTGLGLNITKSLVEMQGGRIWFESEFRKGTTFFFTIPVAETA